MGGVWPAPRLWGCGCGPVLSSPRLVGGARGCGLLGQPLDSTLVLESERD